MTPREPYITVRAVQPVVAALQSLGHMADPILVQAGIPRAVLGDVDGRVPHGAIMRVWERAAAITGDDHLGIHLAEAAPLSSLEVHGYALLSSPTLREAYRRGCRYQRLLHEVTDLSFEEGADEGVLRHALPGGRSVPRHPAEFLVTIWLRLGRLVPGTQWAPRLVCFAHEAPADTTEHARVFQAPVRFLAGATALHVPAAILDLPNPRADAGLVTLLDRYTQTLLDQTPCRDTHSGRVREQLVQALQHGTPTAAQVAGALFMSVRSLHRGLESEGTTFRELLDQLRHERAIVLLSDARCSIADTAFLLGFAEISSFYRAFRRWTGKTPADFRAEALASPGERQSEL
jgi:AraC-like DNA-binding protein